MSPSRRCVAQLVKWRIIRYVDVEIPISRVNKNERLAISKAVFVSPLVGIWQKIRASNTRLDSFLPLRRGPEVITTPDHYRFWDGLDVLDFFRLMTSSGFFADEKVEHLLLVFFKCSSCPRNGAKVIYDTDDDNRLKDGRKFCADGFRCLMLF